MLHVSCCTFISSSKFKRDFFRDAGPYGTALSCSDGAFPVELLQKLVGKCFVDAFFTYN